MAANVKQMWFAWSFGVVAPIAVAILDPLVFKGEGILRTWAPLGYAAIATGTGLLAYCLYARPASDFLAGALFGFAAIAAGIGLLLFPFSVVGLLIAGIGVLGFTPFLTAWAFVRAGKRCVAANGGDTSWALIAWGLALSIVGVIAVQIGVSRLIDGTLRDVELGDYSVARMRILSPFGMEARMCRHWRRVAVEEADHFAVAYQQAFGVTMAQACPEILD
jgi:hypothetical protein